MAIRDLQEIREKLDALSTEEQLELASYLLEKNHAKTQVRSTADFAGSIKLSIDPLEYQKTIRAEWR